MNIVWSQEAVEDLASLRTYIAEDNPAAARRVVLQTIQNVEQFLLGDPRLAGPGAYRAPANLLFQGHTLYRPLSDPARYNSDLARLSWGTTLA
jgi:plasmid stabilization system protein ParE